MEGLAQITSVACPTVDDCWAVGGPSTILRYTGAGWSQEDISTIVGAGAYLQAVTCFDASDCWAVGSNGSSQSLMVRYTASGWAVVSTPAGGYLGGGGSGLGGGIACDAADDCWTIFAGPVLADGNSQGGLAHFDGTAWVGASSPTLTDGDELTDVACPATGEWAVGFSGGESPSGAPPSAALIETNLTP